MNRPAPQRADLHFRKGHTPKVGHTRRDFIIVQVSGAVDICGGVARHNSSQAGTPFARTVVCLQHFLQRCGAILSKTATRSAAGDRCTVGVTICLRSKLAHIKHKQVVPVQGCSVARLQRSSRGRHTAMRRKKWLEVVLSFHCACVSGATRGSDKA